ncbi:MAG TPA: thiamine phosphate synthase [Pirellulaceae bacterium]|nr:thiamine phosphate synthase [Pirellulaceae bacterium]
MNEPNSSDADSARQVRERAATLRILDVNLNRASEGLRVVEEYVRFVLEDRQLLPAYKQLRHDLLATFAAIPTAELAAARNTVEDIGTFTATPTEYQRDNLESVTAANLKRIEQALRALEEYGKLLSPELGRATEQLRYTAYSLATMLSTTQQRPTALLAARLYVLIDGGPSLDSFATQAEALVAAGTQIIQLRDKQLSDRDCLARARCLRQITRGRCLFILNDRPDLALLSAADGVHVGQDEISVRDVRRLVGPQAIVGASTHSLEQACAAARDGASYIGCGPTFPSGTKAFEQFPGVAFLQQVATELALPAFAIGGITLDNLPQVLASGMQRVAVSGAITKAADPSAAARQFLQLLTSCPQPIDHA